MDAINIPGLQWTHLHHEKERWQWRLEFEDFGNSCEDNDVHNCFVKVTNRNRSSCRVSSLLLIQEEEDCCRCRCVLFHCEEGMSVKNCQKYE
jgi:hypothetical protein